MIKSGEGTHIGPWLLFVESLKAPVPVPIPASVQNDTAPEIMWMDYWSTI